MNIVGSRKQNMNEVALLATDSSLLTTRESEILDA